MKIALLNDIHVGGARSDSEVIANHQMRFFKEVFFPYIDKHKITRIFILGDVFERRKYINYKSLKKAFENFFDEAHRRKIKLDILAGNHDCYHSNTNELNSLDLLLSRYDNITLYVQKPAVVEIGGCHIGVMPWICDENRQESLQFLQHAVCEGIFGHFELVGFEMNKGVVCEAGDDPNLFNRFEFVYTGHYHHKSQKKNITYLGSQYDMDWSDYGDIKYFHVFDTKSKKLTPIENPIKAFVKLYWNDGFSDEQDLNVAHKYVKVVVLSKTDFYEFEKAMSALREQHPESLIVIEPELVQAEEGESDSKEEMTLDTVIAKQVEGTNYTSEMKAAVTKLLQDTYTEASATFT